MKLKLGIYIGILALLLTAATGWRMHPVEPEGSELYERYKDMPGVRVGFVKDFPLNDSMVVDVTTFEALTDEGWEWMMEEFDMQRLIDQWNLMDSVYLETGLPSDDLMHAVNFWYSVPDHPEVWGLDNVDPEHDPMDCVAMTPYFRWLASFQTHSHEEAEAVINDFIFLQMNRQTIVPLPKKAEAIQ